MNFCNVVENAMGYIVENMMSEASKQIAAQRSNHSINRRLRPGIWCIAQSSQQDESCVVEKEEEAKHFHSSRSSLSNVTSVPPTGLALAGPLTPKV